MRGAKVKPIKKGVILTIFLLTITLLLTTCKSPTGTLPEEFCKVSFEADGGEPEPEAQLVSKGGLIAEPEAMTRSGNKFDAWYKDEECTTNWDFEKDIVTEDVTLCVPSGRALRGKI